MRRYTLLNPPLECLQEVMVGVNHGRVDAVTENIRAVAAAAMRHARRHEQTIELLDFLEAPAITIAPRLAPQYLPYLVVV